VVALLLTECVPRALKWHSHVHLKPIKDNKRRISLIFCIFLLSYYDNDLFNMFFVTKSFAWIFFLWCFYRLSSTKALGEYFGFFQPPPLTVNDPTLQYLKLQMTLTILSLIREISTRIQTFKIYRKTNIQARVPCSSPFWSSNSLSHHATLGWSENAGSGCGVQGAGCGVRGAGYGVRPECGLQGNKNPKKISK